MVVRLALKAGNHNLLSIIMLCLATFCALSSSMKLGTFKIQIIEITEKAFALDCLLVTLFYYYEECFLAQLIMVQQFCHQVRYSCQETTMSGVGFWF